MIKYISSNGKCKNLRKNEPSIILKKILLGQVLLSVALHAIDQHRIEPYAVR